MYLLRIMRSTRAQGDDSLIYSGENSIPSDLLLSRLIRFGGPVNQLDDEDLRLALQLVERSTAG
jgi:hypothetical protein